MSWTLGCDGSYSSHCPSGERTSLGATSPWRPQAPLSQIGGDFLSLYQERVADAQHAFSIPVVTSIVEQPQFLVQQNRTIMGYVQEFFLYGCEVIF
ncbi:hypothetical protein llap_10599 [Limosa lapponica baueri]|uniref:Uncharacterized protein n=1 Tax=Limosa lapponica baueri TaxID=1758121 RepID=A0A2I0TZ41_LIMLA|nr:hypothetical protein llap_10599 [Limosa lapponica baueri]